MTIETYVPPACPNCGRLTVDNRQHCTNQTPARWVTHCAAMTCYGCINLHAHADDQQAAWKDET